MIQLMVFKAPAIPHPFRRDFRLGPGESRRFFYDADDIQLSELLIRTEGGELFEIEADGYDIEGGPLWVTSSGLKLATPVAREALERAGRPWVLPTMHLLLLLFVPMLWAVRRKLSQRLTGGAQR